MNDRHLLSLLQLTDPALPIGAYAHSSGLETYVQKRIIYNLATSKEFVESMLRYNLHYTDAAFVSLVYDAGVMKDFNKIIQLDEECSAVKLPAEIRSASRKLGIRLLKIFEPLYECSLLTAFKQAIVDGRVAGNYCIAFGLVASVLEISKEEALTGFYYNAAAGMISNCVKLVPIGQQEGQGLLFSLQPLMNSLVQNSLTPDISRIGFCCSGFDIRCMQHEGLYSRVYMS